MKYDELAFLNQQLAGMLKSGIPLEGALQQLCASMQAGKLRNELQLLEADLREGVPFGQALERRKLPEFYIHMVQIGAKTNHLPKILLLLADHYHNANHLWTRLKGIMVYPLIVLIAAFGLSVLLLKAYIDFGHVIAYFGTVFRSRARESIGAFHIAGIWLPAIVLGLLCIATIVILACPRLRERICWCFSVFREARLSYFASSLSLMLQSGCPLNDALEFLKQLEERSPLHQPICQWQAQLAEGNSRVSNLSSSNVIPPLFFWLVSNEGENVEKGLAHAAELYRARALGRAEMLLHMALPVSFLALGVIVAIQLICLFHPAMEGFVELFPEGDMMEVSK